MLTANATDPQKSALFQVIHEQQGFSRIPVYGHDREDILGLLLVKDLIFIDPEDATPVENFIKVFGRAVVGPVWEDQKLDEVLRECHSLALQALRAPDTS